MVSITLTKRKHLLTNVELILRYSNLVSSMIVYRTDLGWTYVFHEIIRDSIRDVATIQLYWTLAVASVGNE